MTINEEMLAVLPPARIKVEMYADPEWVDRLLAFLHANDSDDNCPEVEWLMDNGFLPKPEPPPRRQCDGTTREGA